jgi:hypothetical protein
VGWGVVWGVVTGWWVGGLAWLLVVGVWLGCLGAGVVALCLATGVGSLVLGWVGLLGGCWGYEMAGGGLA